MDNGVPNASNARIQVISILIFPKQFENKCYETLDWEIGKGNTRHNIGWVPTLCRRNALFELKSTMINIRVHLKFYILVDPYVELVVHCRAKQIEKLSPLNHTCSNILFFSAGTSARAFSPGSFRAFMKKSE